MSLEEESSAARALNADSDTLIALLGANRDLFRRHPELLAGLELPHDSGAAVSFIEYQARMLRERNATLQARLESLVRNARDNEAVSVRLHRLTLDLLGAQGAGDMLGLVYAALQDGFRADLYSVRVYADAPPAEQGCGEFVGASAAGSADIDACIASAQPRCGMPAGETLALLFGERADQVRSCALVPLHGAGLRGVLAVAARDAGRFPASAGTVFLQQLGELLTHALLRVVR